MPLPAARLLAALHRYRAVVAGRSVAALPSVAAPSVAPGADLTESHAATLTVRHRAAATIVMVGLLALTAGALAFGQMQSRQQLHERFDLRIALGGRFVESFAVEILTREAQVATRELASDDVSAGDFERVIRAFGFEAAVMLDGEGNAIESVPALAEDSGLGISSRYAHLTTAIAGTPAVSNVVASAVEKVPVVAFAAPFETPYGRRVLSGAFRVESTPLQAHLENAIPFAAGSVYLIDSAGLIVTSNGEYGEALTALAATAPELSAAVARGERTFHREGEDHYLFVQAVRGTPFTLVASVPLASLYGPISGAVLWTPWFVFAALVVGAAYLLRVLSSLSRSQLELRSVSTELARSNSELRDFAVIASHDLQEPLRKIQAFGERLAGQTEGTLDPKSADYLARMRQAAARMQSLVHGLLEYSRISARPVEMERVDLQRLLADVLPDLEERLRATSGRVEVGELPAITASPLAMRQLFQNLIANALKFHRDGVPPIVRVEAMPIRRPARASGNAVTGWELRVSDNGIGFDDRFADQIFVPFQRLHGRQAYEGTGIGLAICRRIAERHEGTITARSTPGVGTTIVVTLPSVAVASG